MRQSEPDLRHLLDLCKKASVSFKWQYSAFLTLDQQQLFQETFREVSGLYAFFGGYEEAERKILIAGNEEDFGYPPDPPICAISVTCSSVRFSEHVTHRDYLGALMSTGIDRSMLGDLIVHESEARFFCLQSVSEYLVSSLHSVRNTSVKAVILPQDQVFVPVTTIPVEIQIPSERLDAVVSSFAGISRSAADALFSSGKVFLNGRTVPDRTAKPAPGDLLSVRGFGKARYTGILRQTRKGRLVAQLLKYSDE